MEAMRYDFRCPRCGLRFEVSRPISKAAEPALCPQDGTRSERVFTMPATFVKGGARPDSGPSPTSGAGDDHAHGHSHGPGPHTH